MTCAHRTARFCSRRYAPSRHISLKRECPLSSPPRQSQKLEARRFSTHPRLASRTRRIPYDRILPPRLFKQFAATVKLIFTRDGERDISVIRKSDIGNLFNARKVAEARTELANLRLESIATLPHLGVFSAEAHHTYGQARDTELKKVRKTVDYPHLGSSRS